MTIWSARFNGCRRECGHEGTTRRKRRRVPVAAVADMFDSVEGEPWEKVVLAQFRLATAQIRELHVRSAFYRDRLDQAGIGPDFTVGGWDDLAPIPTTDKNALRRSLAEHPPLGSHLAVPRERLTQI